MILQLLMLLIVGSTLAHGYKFPENFLFGTASSSYQIEGAWNTDGKGANIWDVFTHTYPERIADHSTGNISSDAYHNLEEDVILLKRLGVHFYTFSLSWSRILPAGLSNQINPSGLHYYNLLINLLLKHNIIPMVALCHWDVPQPIEDLGGFTNSLIEEWFEDYARVVFENFGNRVKLWLTFNDPKEMCLRGYGGSKAAPGYNSTGVGDYMCAHNVLKAHARVYHLYNDIYKPLYKGRVSIGLGSNWYDAATTNTEDVHAALRALEFSLGWFADPIYHPLGLYPKTMHKEVETRSFAEGYTISRLPQFEKEESSYIKGSYDYFALNHYTSEVVSNAHEEPFDKPSYGNDRRVKFSQGGNGAGHLNANNKTASEGFQKLLKYIKQRYQNPEIFVTGNGFSDRGDLDDLQRIKYIEKHLGSVLNAIQKDEVNVVGYAVWSFLDGFEWENGYTEKFGLYHVDFTSPTRTRTPKSSAMYYKDVIANKRLIITDKGASANLVPSTLLFIIIIVGFCKATYF